MAIYASGDLIHDTPMLLTFGEEGSIFFSKFIANSPAAVLGSPFVISIH